MENLAFVLHWQLV